MRPASRRSSIARADRVRGQMSIRNFEKLFRPQRVALIGASERPGSVGAVVTRNLLRAGFAGDLLLVNPHSTTIDGVAVHRDIACYFSAPGFACASNFDEHADLAAAMNVRTNRRARGCVEADEAAKPST